VKSPLIQASSRCATTTGFFPFIDNPFLHLAADRRSHGEPSDPLPEPRRRALPLVDDDGRDPSDHDLIVRPTSPRTDSGAVSR
jgi:hypothetical protein